MEQLPSNTTLSARGLKLTCEHFIYSTVRRVERRVDRLVDLVRVSCAEFNTLSSCAPIDEL